MPADWPSVELRCLIEPERGISYGIVQPGTPVVDGVPIVRVSDVREGRIKVASPLRVSKEVEAAYSRTRLRGGELLITIVGTVGETAIVPASLAGWNVARAIAVLPIQSEVGARWVKRALLSPAASTQIRSRLNTTVQATLNLGDLAKLPILLPPPPERERIEAMLGSLDDKIDLNHRMNETLEALARAIFKDWFVNFGPTRAMMEGRTPYLEPAIWESFPDRLDGQGIPKGWGEVRVEKLLELAYGKSLPAGERNAGHVPVYGSGGINGFHDQSLVDGPAIIVGRKGTVGSLYWEHQPCFPIDTVFFVRSKLPLTYCFHLLQTLGLMEMNTDAAVPGLNRSNVYRLLVPHPPAALIQRFGVEAATIREKMAANAKENASLSEMRDLLLPKLMSGQIHLKDAEQAAASII